MNTINKLLVSGLLSLTMLTAVAQPEQGNPPQGGQVPGAPGLTDCQMHQMMQPVEFQSTKVVFVPQLQAFVAIDSAECKVHLVERVGEDFDIVGYYSTDSTYKRHDIGKILRPVSVGVFGDRIVLVASGSNYDTAYVGVIGMKADENGRLPLVTRVDFSNRMFATHFAGDEMICVGTNPLGYDVRIFDLKKGIDNISRDAMQRYHYRIAKQSEKIKQSDPVGIGLTAVAVAVVFLALVCIAVILTADGKFLARLESRAEEKKRSKVQKEKKVKPVSTTVEENDVFAAIAAAVHLYNNELHDEEETVITIQKVEREWTPWNAKYYNMNHYFNNSRR